MKRPSFIVSAILFSAVLLVLWAEAKLPQPIKLTPTVTGQPEYCLTCHSDLAHISPAHPVEVVGCVRCHGGERLALDAELAHSTLRGGRNPSDPAVAELSCGGVDCHSGAAQADRDHIQRLAANLHTTYAGAITQVQNAGSSLEDFTQDCRGCHLASLPLTGTQYTRFTGCAACHTPTTNIDQTQSVHRLTTAIAYNQCNTCHNRGTYNIHTLQFEPRADQPAGRQHDYYLPGTQMATCEFRLDCVDCHTRQEIMGDGHPYGTLHAAQYIQCRTCHGTLTDLPLTATITRPDDLALRLAALNPAIRLQTGDTIIITERGEPLWNTRQQPDGSFEIIGKVTGQHQRLPVVRGSACQQNPAQQEAADCHACHSTSN
jgi:hypothetical protein